MSIKIKVPHRRQFHRGVPALDNYIKCYIFLLVCLYSLFFIGLPSACWAFKGNDCAMSPQHYSC